MMEYRATFSDGSQASTLSHHGITGMKWYRRRYQNPDGSLTPAGRARYLKNAERADMYRQKASDASLKSAKYAYKRDKVAARRVQTDLSIGKANKLSANSSRANVKAVKYERKAKRLDKANKDLTTPVEWSEKQIQKHRLKELGDDAKVIKQYAKANRLSMAEAMRRYDATMEEYSKIKNSDVAKKYPHDYETVGHPMQAGGYANIKLMNDIEAKSGSWYFGDVVKGSNFESAMKSYKKSEKSFAEANSVRRKSGNGRSWHGSKEKEQAKQKVLDAVLKDLGFPITQANRDAIRSSVFWD